MTVQDRRKHHRWADDNVSATLSTSHSFGHYRVQDISAEGVSLLGGPLVRLGAEVEVVVRMSDTVIARVAGKVVRHQLIDARGVALGIALADEGADVEDALQDVALRRIEGGLVPAVLIVSSCSDTQPALAAAVEPLGVPVVLARTPLEAIAVIVDPDRKIRAVLVDAALRPTSGAELAALIADAYPDVRCVLIQASPGTDTPGLPTMIMPITVEQTRDLLAFPWATGDQATL